MNITKFPNKGYATTKEQLAEHLRELAGWIETGEYSDSDPRNIIVIVEHEDGHLSRLACGQQMDRARGVGVLQMAVTYSALGDL